MTGVAERYHAPMAAPALLRRAASRCTAFVAALALAGSAFAQGATLEGRALVDALRHGGYVLYMRHTSTDFGESDDRMTSFEDCSKQRNLTDRGRAEARAIGIALRELAIPIGQVLASPYCRTLETGRLVFGSTTVSMAVRGGPARPDSPDRYAELRQLLSTPPPRGTNLAIASHGNPFYGVAGPPYLAEGEIAVIEPQGNDGFRIVAKVAKDGWAPLVAAAK
jgi:phosphohistidine phosphatase SixA